MKCETCKGFGVVVGAPCNDGSKPCCDHRCPDCQGSGENIPKDLDNQNVSEHDEDMPKTNSLNPEMVKEAVRKFQEELDASAPAIAKVLEDFDAEAEA